MLIVFKYCGEFDNWGAVMSVSSNLLCSFELLKPLDSSALKNHIKRGRNARQNMLNSPVCLFSVIDRQSLTYPTASTSVCTKLLGDARIVAKSTESDKGFRVIPVFAMIALAVQRS